MKKVLMVAVLGLTLFFAGFTGVKAMSYDECVDAWAQGCSKWRTEAIRDICIAEGELYCLFH